MQFIFNWCILVRWFYVPRHGVLIRWTVIECNFYLINFVTTGLHVQIIASNIQAIVDQIYYIALWKSTGIGTSEFT